MSRATITEGLRVARRHAMQCARNCRQLPQPMQRYSIAINVRSAREINHHLVRELRAIK